MEVVVNAVVLPMTTPGARAQAVAFDAGKIVAVGSRAEVVAAAGPGAAVLDAAGGAVVPGFVDAHHHLALGLLYEGCIDCSSAHLLTVAAVTDRLAAGAGDLPPGAWAVGIGFDPLSVRERRFPTRDELDAACPDRPALVLHFTFHQGVANSRALEAARIDRSTPDPPGGLIQRSRGGVPTGRLVEAALFGVELLARESISRVGYEELCARLARQEGRLWAVGITRIADAAVSPDLEAFYRRARADDRLRLPVVMMPTSGAGLLAPPWDRLDGPPTGDGDDRLRVGPLKAWFDGGLHCAMCISLPRYVASAFKTIGTAVRRLSLDPLRIARDTVSRLGADGRVRTGYRFLSPERGRELVQKASERGFGVAIHAIGNDAIEQAVAAMEGARLATALPPRIEHGPLMSRDLLSRVADLGASVVVQPAFLLIPALACGASPVGVRPFPLRSMLDAKIAIVGSSDAPVLSHDPLEGIRIATTRRGPRGERLDPGEAITVEEALTAYTREAARACGCLDACGTLEPGKRADLAFLSADPVASGPALEGVRVVRTILGGETVWAGTP